MKVLLCVRPKRVDMRAHVFVSDPRNIMDIVCTDQHIAMY